MGNTCCNYNNNTQGFSDPLNQTQQNPDDSGCHKS